MIATSKSIFLIKEWNFQLYLSCHLRWISDNEMKFIFIKQELMLNVECWRWIEYWYEVNFVCELYYSQVILPKIIEFCWCIVRDADGFVCNLIIIHFKQDCCLYTTRQYKQQNAVLSVIWSMTQAIECNELKCLFFIWHLLTVLFIALGCDFDSYKIYFIFIFHWHTLFHICTITKPLQCLIKKSFF